MADMHSQMKPTDVSVGLSTALDDLAIPADKLRQIHKGGTSQVWLHDTGAGPRRILKLSDPGRGTPLFPNTPRAEWEAMKRLSSEALAPFPLTIRKLEGGARLLVSQYLPSKGHVTADALADLMRRIHATSGWTGLARQTTSLLELHAQGADMLARTTAPLWLESLAPEVTDDCTSPRLTLVHRDLVPANVAMLKTGTAVALDWQCPALGDPCEDIAHATSPGMQSLCATNPTLKDADLLAAYGDRAVSQAYARRAPFYRWRMACYCQWQLDRGQQVYAKALDLECAALEEACSRADRAG